MSRGECKGVRSEPCGPCPWRTSNHGSRALGGLYTQKHRADLWRPFMKGDAPGMSCHPTDPDFEHLDGTPNPVPDGSGWWECAGAIHLVEVEMRAVEMFVESHGPGEGMRMYRADARERGVYPMTTEGFLAWGFRAAPPPFGAGMPLPDLTEVEWADEVSVGVKR